MKRIVALCVIIFIVLVGIDVKISYDYFDAVISSDYQTIYYDDREFVAVSNLPPNIKYICEFEAREEKRFILTEKFFMNHCVLYEDIHGNEFINLTTDYDLCVDNTIIFCGVKK